MPLLRMPQRGPILFGLRTATAGMLALFVAFWLQLDDPGWAGTSAVIVAQPVLGASLRKGTFRLFGTLAGALFAVLLTAAFPQDRIGFLFGLALWGGACGFASTYLQEFASYGAMLAGYTAAIVATAAIASPPDVFLIAAARGSCIAIGIMATTAVFAMTDLGHRRADLAEALEQSATDVLAGLRGLLGESLAPLDEQRTRRRALVVRVAGLDTVLDQAIGENFDLRTRVGGLRRALAGLLAALSSWRGMEQHIRRLPGDVTPLTTELRHVLDASVPSVDDAARLRGTGHAMLNRPARDVSHRLLTDRLGEALLGLADVAAALVLLRAPQRAAPIPDMPFAPATDPVVALINGARAFLVAACAEAFWVASGWTEGGTFLIFAMVVGLLFALRGDAAYTGGAQMAASCAIALSIAAALRFAILPAMTGVGLDGFGAFAAALGGAVFLLGFISDALRTGTAASALAFGTLGILVPMFSPQNVITYDLAAFLNTAFAILAGATFGAASYRLVPGLHPGVLAARLLRGARDDVRRLARGRWSPGELEWERRLYGRLLQLPPEATPLDHAHVLAALSIGRDMLRARRLVREGAPESALRLRTVRREIADTIASHPEFFAKIPSGAI